jgi:hypothetical protein
MTKLKLAARAAALSVASISAMASAALLPPGSDNVTPDDFAAISDTQGDQLGFASLTGATETFRATVRSAVYRNTLGTLDFYYQVSRLGAGTDGNDLIKTLTATNYAGVAVDVFRSMDDPDGVGGFLETSGTVTPLTTLGRTPDGNVPTISFALPGQAGIGGTDTTATYIFRTDAVDFTTGFWSIQDGTSLSSAAFAPVAVTTPVPEPGSWLLMVSGFGMLGVGLRVARRQQEAAVA